MLSGVGLDRRVRAPLEQALAEFQRGRIGPREIELNQASKAMLRRVPGIGPVLAQRIVDHRRDRLFEQVDDLQQIPGFPSSQLAFMRRYLYVADRP